MTPDVESRFLSYQPILPFVSLIEFWQIHLLDKTWEKSILPVIAQMCIYKS